MEEVLVIKALEHWVKAYNRGCVIAAHALDLINRPKAEIERYKGVIKILEKDVSEEKFEAITAYMAEVERRCIESGIYPVIVKNVLHNVKKEMVGE